MSDKRITELSSIVWDDLADDDQFTVVDVSDTTMDPTGTNKRVPKSQMQAGIDAAVAAHTGDASAAHAASAISYNGAAGLSATDVEAALDELDTEKASTGSVTTVSDGLAAHIADAADAHDASAISVLDTAGNFTGTDVEAVLAELPGRYAPITTKRVTLSLGGDNGRGSASGWSNLNQRLLVQLPSTTTRWRMKFGNRDPRTNALYATARTVTGVWIGDPVFPSTGTWAAQMDNQVQAISTSFGSASDGSDGTSEWVTDPAHQFQANRPTVVSWGLTGQFASSISRAQAGGVVSSTGGTSDAAANAGSDLPTQALYGEYVFGDPRIEYEVLDDLPVVMAIGDSNTMGALAAVEGYGAMHYENWIGAAGLMNGFHVVNLAVLGSRTTDWLDDGNMVWTRFDLATTAPDACVIALGINDVSADTSADDIKANLVTIIGMVRDLGVKHVYLDTIPPNNGSGTRETVRTTVNTWIRTKPCGIAGVPDADAAMRDPADTDTTPALFMPTPPHFTKAGHQFRARTFMFRR